jgi:hypothetical protein
MVFTLFSCLFFEEIPSSNPLQRAGYSFLIAACAFKSCSPGRKPPVILKIIPKACYECALEKVYQ